MQAQPRATLKTKRLPRTWIGLALVRNKSGTQSCQILRRKATSVATAIEEFNPLVEIRPRSTDGGSDIPNVELAKG
jgi:hypothetical protein